MTQRNRRSNQRRPRRPSGRARSQPNNHPDARNPGDTGGEAIPVPIPNTEVKLSSAEDTERAAFRENRSSPGFLRFRAIRCPPTRASRPGRPAGILGGDDRSRRSRRSDRSGRRSRVASSPSRSPAPAASNRARAARDRGRDLPVPVVVGRAPGDRRARPRPPLHRADAAGSAAGRQAAPPLPRRRARRVLDLPGGPGRAPDALAAGADPGRSPPPTPPAGRCRGRRPSSSSRRASSTR